MRISIALATFNGAAYLEAQIKSILQGSRQPDEWVVVDDASTDASLELARRQLMEAAARASTCTTNPANLGASASFARAAALATGDVILFCDQDDIWDPDKVRLVEEEFARDDDLVLTYHDGAIIDAHGKPDGRTIWGTRKHARLERGGDRDPMEVAANPDVKGCSLAIKGSFAHELFARTPPEFHRYWGHDHWMALFAWGCGRVKAVPLQLIAHRLHGRNTSAGARFNPLSPAHWQQRMRAARSQAADHGIRRYAMALEVANSYGERFDARLLSALIAHREYEERRMALGRLSVPRRIRAAIALWSEGYYRKHANGAWTLFRDLVG